MLNKGTKVQPRDFANTQTMGLVADLRWGQILPHPISVRKKWWKRHCRRMYKIALLSCPRISPESDGLAYYHLMWTIRLSKMYDKFKAEGKNEDAEWIEWLAKQYEIYYKNSMGPRDQRSKPRRIQPGYYVQL
jgi:hypothetical protein